MATKKTTTQPKTRRRVAPVIKLAANDPDVVEKLLGLESDIVELLRPLPEAFKFAMFCALVNSSEKAETTGEGDTAYHQRMIEMWIAAMSDDERQQLVEWSESVSD